MQNPTRELDAPGIATLIASKLKADIDNYAVRTYSEPHRWHLGASIIGHECSRYLWYSFRWIASEAPEGRKLRLFNRGHREEARFEEFLTGIGAQLWTRDESQPRKSDGQFPQFRMSAVGGHFGGSTDGIMRLPESYGIDEPLLAEFKTNGTGKGFNDTVEKGVAVAKPQHWSQICTYGNNWKIRYGGYFIVNKNDDDLEIQIVKLDWKLGEQMTLKAERIIRSQEPPPRLSDNPTFFKCQYCPMKDPCHHGAKPEFNCRSCKACSPVDSGEFFCNVYNAVIPRDIVPKGCQSYKAIVNDT